MVTEKIIVIVGPTATGKSDLALELAQKVGGEIINADAGQLYEPLTIGTAKPHWRAERIPHHLFDCVKTPHEMNAGRWVELTKAIVTECHQRKRIPIIVGGSGFYVASLFYPFSSRTIESNGAQERLEPTPELYQQLLCNDPIRAAEIHPNDRYRIIRALLLLQRGITPSAIKPRFNPKYRGIIISLDRPDEELRERVSYRIGDMFQRGWREEVETLTIEWREFASRKQLIGYGAIAEGNLMGIDLQKAIEQETWQYIRRQRTFLRGLKKKLDMERLQWGDAVPHWKEYCLTSVGHAVYLDEILSQISLI